MIGNFPIVLHLNQSFFKLNRFSCNKLPVLPVHRSQASARRLTLGMNLHQLGASHGYILMAHMNKCTLLHNVMIEVINK